MLFSRRNWLDFVSAISTSLFSYAGQVRVGMVCDGCVFPDSSDVPTLINEFEKEILYTAKLTGVPPSSCFNNFINENNNQFSNGIGNSRVVKADGDTATETETS